MDELTKPFSATVLALKELNPDEERLAQLGIHLKTGDYFATLTYIMSFIEDTLATCDTRDVELKTRELSLLEDIKKDLTHLQENYRIEPKTV
jgi:hypothetical protein